MSIFGKISEIDIDDHSTWVDRAFLTFDIDWVNDSVLLDTIELVESAGISATWFATHNTPLLSRLRSNPMFELGIHPNFNPLLQGDNSKAADALQVIKQAFEIVPDSLSVRSHSIAQSGPILQAFAESGLTHDSNYMVPESAGIPLRPWRMNCGMTEVPYCWADEHISNGRQSNDFKDIIRRVGLAVFDFHPIHVFINTDSPSSYSKVRPHLSDVERLIKYRNLSSCGARSALELLLEVAR